MKKLIQLSICFLFAIQQSFAGTGFYAEYKMSSKLEAQNIVGNMKVYSSSEGNSRSEVNMNVPGSPSMNLVSLFMKSDPKYIYMLYLNSKSYSKIEINKYSDVAKDDAKYEIKIIGTEKVNGYMSTHIKISRDGKEFEDLWFSKEVPGYKGMNFSSSKYMPSGSLYEQLKGKDIDGMVVRIMAGDAPNSVQVDLVKAEQKELSSSLFAIPSDCKETSMIEGMMKEMNMPTMDELMKMTPADREYWIKKMEQKYK